MGATLARVTSLPARPDDRTARLSRAGQDRLASLFAAGTVRSGRDLGPDGDVVSGADLLPVLPSLRDLLPDGGLRRGSVVAASDGWSLLCLALAAEAVADGAWCAVAGVPEVGVAAAAGAGLDSARLLIVPKPGPNWPQVVASLLDGCDLVLLRPPDRPSASARRKLEAVVRRHRAVLIVAGDWDGAQVRLRMADQEWTGIGAGHGRLHARRARVVADGRGGWSQNRARWLWLPGPDGTVSTASAVIAVGAGTDEIGLAVDREAAEVAGAG